MKRLVLAVSLLVVFKVYTVHSAAAIHEQFNIKCPLGNYHFDGCTICECDTLTGQTQCRKTGDCVGIQRNCPDGTSFRDRNGNKCTCYEETGSVYCSIVKIKPPKKVVPIATITVNNRKPGLNFKSKQDLTEEEKKRLLEELLRSYVES